MTPEQAIKEAQEQQLRPVYWLVGDERHLAGKVVQAVRAAATKGGIPGVEQKIPNPSFQDSDVEAALSAARTLPTLMKPSGASCLVRGLEHWEPREGSEAKEKANAPLDRLLEYTQNPSPSTTLVLLGGGLSTRSAAS